MELSDSLRSLARPGSHFSVRSSTSGKPFARGPSAPAAVEGVVILEFPTFEEAKAWYDSPAYRKVREHRYKG
jgi:uncharacterized protein (DUF1330 family)